MQHSSRDSVRLLKMATESVASDVVYPLPVAQMENFAQALSRSTEEGLESKEMDTLQGKRDLFVGFPLCIYPLHTHLHTSFLKCINGATRDVECRKRRRS